MTMVPAGPVVAGAPISRGRLIGGTVGTMGSSGMGEEPPGHDAQAGADGDGPAAAAGGGGELVPGGGVEAAGEGVQEPAGLLAEGGGGVGVRVAVEDGEVVADAAREVGAGREV